MKRHPAVELLPNRVVLVALSLDKDRAVVPGKTAKTRVKNKIPAQ
jgi:hypothetical protein